MNGNLVLLHTPEISFKFTMDEMDTLLTEVEIFTKMLMLQIQLYIRKNTEWKEIPIKFDIGKAVYRWKIVRGVENDNGNGSRTERTVERKIERNSKETAEKITEEITEEISVIKETRYRKFQREILFILLTESLDK